MYSMFSSPDIESLITLTITCNSSFPICFIHSSGKASLMIWLRFTKPRLISSIKPATWSQSSSSLSRKETILFNLPLIVVASVSFYTSPCNFFNIFTNIFYFICLVYIFLPIFFPTRDTRSILFASKISL